MPLAVAAVEAINAYREAVYRRLRMEHIRDRLSFLRIDCQFQSIESRALLPQCMRPYFRPLTDDELKQAEYSIATTIPRLSVQERTLFEAAHDLARCDNRLPLPECKFGSFPGPGRRLDPWGVV